jgi:hypothetical protein
MGVQNLPLPTLKSLLHSVPRLVITASLLLSVLTGCQKNPSLEDPQLRPLQEMLDSQVPLGTARSNVSLFLDTQGYRLEQSQKPGTLVAVIRKIDTQRMEPITARVTFYFDAQDKLSSVEFQRTLNEPIQ